MSWWKYPSHQEIIKYSIQHIIIITTRLIDTSAFYRYPNESVVLRPAMGEPEKRSIDEESTGTEEKVVVQDDSQYPSAKKVIPIMIALYLVVFLIALVSLPFSTLYHQ